MKAMSAFTKPSVVLPDGFVLRADLSRAATPTLLRQRPIHRWFWFPHSYSPELVEAILEAWDLPPGSRLLDPFCGAGTTLLVARERGFPAAGVDLSPLAVLASRAKTRWPGSSEGILSSLQRLRRVVSQQLRVFRRRALFRPVSPPSPRLARAFTPIEWAALSVLREWILQLPPSFERDLLWLALLRILPRFSRASGDGGWLRWVERPEATPEQILSAFEEEIRRFTEDLEWRARHPVPPARVSVHRMDARRIHRLPRMFDAVITSPPYPNRHDYTRIFHIELLFMGCREEDILRLRRESLRSHVEARGLDLTPEGYLPPSRLQAYLNDLKDLDPRVPRMVAGYFEDLFWVLRGARQILNPGARLALVVGNARYGGQILPADELMVEIGEQAGYRFEGAWVIRLRGNSAQQMGRYGRLPSRESVVFLKARA